MLVLRVFKSVYYALVGTIPDFLPVVGVVAMSIMGPLSLFYAYRIMGRGKLLHWRHWIHFIIPAILTLNFFIKDRMFLDYAYLVAIVSNLIYLLIILFQVRHVSARVQGWIHALIGAMGITVMVYLVHYIGIGELGYTISTFVAAFTILILAYLAWHRYDLLSKIHHYRLSRRPENFSYADIMLINKLKNKISDVEVVSNPDLSLSSLADELGCSTSKLSVLFQTHYKGSFPDVINEVRITHARTLLLNPEHEHEKIYNIAYFAGFKSSSNFYAQFKKHFGVTPSEFRKNNP